MKKAKNKNIKIEMGEKKEEQKEEKKEENKKVNKIEKVDSGIFHDDHGKLLYKPDEEYELKSCCGSACQVDKGYMEFLAKTIVSLSVLTFCFIQLSKGSQSEFASSTISLILGTYLGSTTNQLKERKK